MADHWILGLGLLIAFYMAWNIGANDVANAFGTSIGSGALTFRKAMVIAAVFEFSGALLAGSHVADTIKGSIVHPSFFVAQPDAFALGMLVSLLAASIWLHVATWMGQPVSTTHAIIGAVIGFGVAAFGPHCVQWHQLGRIAASWFVSPVVGGGMAFCVYYGIRKLILRHDTPTVPARRAVPLCLGLIMLVVGLSTLPALLARCTHLIPHSRRIWIWAGVGSMLISALSIMLARRLLVHSPGAGPDRDEYATVERWFSRLQIVTACYMSFAHGANDVANAIGPIAGILQAVRGEIAAKAPVPMWLLAFGGVGIVIGLAMYGHKVVESVGKKITEVTPTRGFSAEISTATTVLACSLLGLPISTTFVLVGAVMGVGLARGFGAIDLSVVRRIFLSWVVTIPLAALLSAALYLGLKWILP